MPISARKTRCAAGAAQGRRRGGTENLASIIGFGRACELAAENLDEERTCEASLRDRLEKALLKKCPDAAVIGDRENRLPNTTNVSFEFVEGEAILLRLDAHGVCASSGSACTSGSLEPSHVLRAMAVPFTRLHGSVRLSLSRYTTEEDIDKVIEVFPGIIRDLRALSPYGKGKEPGPSV